MKTTVEIADELLARVRESDMTLRALVNEGLRLVLEKHARPAKSYKFEPIVVGKPWRPGMPAFDVNAMIAESYEERLPKALRVAEPGAPEGRPAAKRGSTRKRKRG